MTQDMAIQVISFRLEGLGYQAIAMTLGISKDSVRYFCKTHGLDGKAELVRINFEEHKKNPEVCKYCGGLVERNPHSGKKLFCSDVCRRAWWKEHPEASMQTETMRQYRCACCNRVFYSSRNRKRKYCSHDCYIHDRFHNTDRSVNFTDDM